MSCGRDHFEPISFDRSPLAREAEEVPGVRVKRPHGGRRPGAGAPRGNLNALKHGRRSRQFAEIGAILAGSPATMGALLALSRRKGTSHARAEEVAADLLVRLFNHARDVAHGKTSPGPFAGIARLNVIRKALSDAQSARTRDEMTAALEDIRTEIEKPAPHNQTPG